MHKRSSHKTKEEARNDPHRTHMKMLPKVPGKKPSLLKKIKAAIDHLQDIKKEQKNYCSQLNILIYLL